MKTIYLAGGCFWGIQKYMDQFDGILETSVGYANGNSQNPTYEQVKAGISTHAETVKVDYDETKISLEEILNKFYLVIDPTSLNKQGEDEGINYRCGIYYTDNESCDIALKVTDQIKGKYDQALVIEIQPLENYYLAEEYHQKYLEKNPQGYCHIQGCFFHS